MQVDLKKTAPSRFVLACRVQADVTQAQQRAEADGWASKLSVPGHQIWARSVNERVFSLSVETDQSKDGTRVRSCRVMEFPSKAVFDQAAADLV